MPVPSGIEVQAEFFAGQIRYPAQTVKPGAPLAGPVPDSQRLHLDRRRARLAQCFLFSHSLDYVVNGDQTPASVRQGALRRQSVQAERTIRGLNPSGDENLPGAERRIQRTAEPHADQGFGPLLIPNDFASLTGQGRPRTVGDQKQLMSP